MDIKQVSTESSIDTPSVADLPQPAKEKQTNELAFILAVDEGQLVRDAARAHGIPLRTASRILARADVDEQASRDAIRKLMVNKSLEAVDRWQTAMQVGAEKKGNHAPAKDWLLHAGLIDPIQADANLNVKVAICIGTPEQPMSIPSPQSVEAEIVSEK